MIGDLQDSTTTGLQHAILHLVRQEQDNLAKVAQELQIPPERLARELGKMSKADLERVALRLQSKP